LCVHAGLHEQQSAIEHKPAQVISQSLIVQHKLENRIRQLLALPLAFKPAGALGLTLQRSGSNRLDCVSCSAEFVRGHMRDSSRLAGRICSMTGCTLKISGCCIRVAGGVARLRHGDFATRPLPDQRNSLTWPRICRLHKFKKMQHMLCAGRSPQGEQLVIGIGERSAAPNRDETRVAIFGENHVVRLPEMIRDHLKMSFRASARNPRRRSFDITAQGFFKRLRATSQLIGLFVRNRFQNDGA
jgi:hypothetical protein